MWVRQNQQTVWKLLILYLGLQGRMSRGQYWPIALIITMTWVILLNVGFWLFTSWLWVSVVDQPPETPSFIVLRNDFYLSTAPFILFISLMHFIVISLKRLHDINDSGWHLLAWGIPFASVFIYYFFCMLVIIYISDYDYLDIILFLSLIIVCPMLILISFVAWLVLMIKFAGKGTTGKNKYGNDPLNKPDNKNFWVYNGWKHLLVSLGLLGLSANVLYVLRDDIYIPIWAKILSNYFFGIYMALVNPI